MRAGVGHFPASGTQTKGEDSWGTKKIFKNCILRVVKPYASSPIQARTDVADPWYTGDFEATWQDVLEGCQGLLNNLTKKEA